MTGVTAILYYILNSEPALKGTTTDEGPFGTCRNHRVEKGQDCLTRQVNRLLLRNVEPKYIWNGELETLPQQIIE